jgi:hypothetical protein
MIIKIIKEVEKMRKKLMNSLNPKGKEVKKMKKLVFLALVAIFIVALAGVGMADVINPGSFGVKYLDQSVAQVAGGGPAGNIYGVVALSSTHNLIDGNPENQNLAGVSYYNNGADGYYYFGVYGGLTPILTVGNVTYLGETASGSYLNIYRIPVADGDVYSTAVVAGIGDGSGTLGSFGTDIINAVGAQLFLELAAPKDTNTGVPDYMSTYLGAPPGTVEEFTVTGTFTGKTVAYWDVIGGLGASLVDTNGFPFIPNLYWNAPPLLDSAGNPIDADLKIVSDLTLEVSPFGWTTSSEDPVTGLGTTIPEPSTIILLGAGLFGIGIFGRKRMKG